MRTTLTLTALLAAQFAAMPAQAQNVYTAKGLSLNGTAKVQSSSAPLTEASAPKKLWAMYGGRYGRNFYAGFYQFVVAPGEKYTLYAWFPPDGVYRNLYVLNENPLTDRDRPMGVPSGYMSNINFVPSSLPKVACEALTKRYNITIAPGSEHQSLYLVVTSRTPAQSITVMLKRPADPDDVVSADIADPACPPRKGFHWGQVTAMPLFLKLDPTETGRSLPRTEPPPVSPKPGPGNKIGLETPPIESPPRAGRGTAPRGIAAWVAHVKSGQPFLVRFDMTTNKFNDARYSGDWRTDPMGTLQGGQEYTVSYRNGEFSCTGFNQARAGVETQTGGGADPDDGLISLWGRTFAIDGLGQVWDPDFGLVGHLHIR